MSRYLDSRGEKLGYELLQMTQEDLAPACAVAARQAIGEGGLAAKWASDCRARVKEERAKLRNCDKTEDVRYLIRPVDTEQISALPELATQEFVEWSEPLGPAKVPADGAEEYLLSGVVKDSGEQGMPVPLEIMGRRTVAPSLDVHLGAAAGSFENAGARKFGIGLIAGVQATFLELLSIDVTSASLYGTSSTDEPVDDTRWGFGLGMRLGYLVQSFARSPQRSFLLDVDAGAMTKGGSYARLRIGYGWTPKFAIVLGGLLGLGGAPSMGTLAMDLQAD